eukprot:scaffold66019_cov64-Phaeocystis_antarctica.AAC.4
MGSPMNNDSAKKWHQYGRHVRQKEPAPSAEVRRTTPARFTGFVRAPHDTFPCVASVARASTLEDVCALTQSCRASIVPRSATTIDEAAREAAGKAAL